MKNLAITISIDGDKKRVLAVDYIKAKTRQLREFGYPDLTEVEVEAQLLKLLNCEELNVIGMFMDKEVEG